MANALDSTHQLNVWTDRTVMKIVNMFNMIDKDKLKT